MNKFKSYCLLTLIFAIVSISNAQSQVQVYGSETLLDKLRLNKSIKGITDTYYSDIAGDPYLCKDFFKGKVTMKNGEIYDVDLRYDIYAGEIHFRVKDVVYVIANQNQVQSVEIDNNKFVYSDYKLTPGTENVAGSTYFILLTGGRCKLLAKKNIRIKDPEPPKLYQEAKPAKFILKDDTYYLKLGEKSAVKIKGKKDLLEILGDQQDNLKTFLRSNKLSTGKREDLIKIISFYNEF